MKKLPKINKIIIMGLGLFFASCNFDHLNPLPYWNRHQEEADTANRVLPTLTDDGKLPPVAPPPAPAAEAKPAVATATNAASEIPAAAAEKFATICATCHGEDGKANTPAGSALNPKPRNFTDKEWQKKVTDEHIAKVMKEGGAANGLSPLMAPFGAMLTEDEVKGLVLKVRSFGK
jgi:mono/diheme cytochrome c family protein